MELESSLQQLQATATCPYPEPVQSSPCPPFHFNIMLSSTRRSSKWSHFLRSPHPNPVRTSPASDTRLLPYLILLDLITRMVFGEYYVILPH
jgi:hypothetical protein